VARALRAPAGAPALLDARPAAMVVVRIHVGASIRPDNAIAVSLPPIAALAAANVQLAQTTKVAQMAYA